MGRAPPSLLYCPPVLPSCSPFPYCAALARHNGTAPALHSCSPFSYCATLSRRNGTAPALPFVSPSPYCISFFIGPRHMSSNSRRALLLDRIALELQAEGIPYTEALDKSINEFLNSKNLEDLYPSSDSEREMQEHYFTLLKRENEKLIRELEKMCIELRYEIDKVRYEIDKVSASQHLYVRLERGGMCDELAKNDAKIIDLITELDREIHTLQAQQELVNALRSSESLVGLITFLTVCGIFFLSC